ncbi:MAG: DUF1015 family protein, partial [Runella zeae]
ISQKILIKNKAPALYYYEIIFPFEGETYLRRGFILLTKLYNFQEGMILPHEKETLKIGNTILFRALYKKTWFVTLATVVAVSGFFLLTNRALYQYPSYEKLDTQKYFTRFGPEAAWRSKPNLKNAQHK